MGSESKKSDDYEIAPAAKPLPMPGPVPGPMPGPMSDKVGKAAPKCADSAHSADCSESAADPKSVRSDGEARWALDVEWCLRMMS